MSNRDAHVFARNLAASWVSRVVVLLVTFVVTSMLVQSLGRELYGLWAIGFTLMSYLSLADGGVSAGLVRTISAARAGGVGSIAEYVAAALVFYLLLGIALLAVVYVARDPLASVLGVSPRLSTDARILFLGVTAVLVINNLAGVFLSALNALEFIHISSMLNLLSALGGGAALVAVVVLVGPHIQALVLASIAVACLALVVSIVTACRVCPELRQIRVTRIHRSHIRELARLSLGIQVSNLAGAVNFSVDKPVLAALVGLSTAAVYDLAGRLTVVIWTLAWLVANAALPTAARLSADRDRLRVFYLRADRYLQVTACGLAGLLAVLAPYLVQVWLGHGYGQVVVTTQVLAIASAGISLTNVASVALWGIGRTAEVTIFSLWRLVMHVVLSLALTSKFGLAGALAGATASFTLPSAWLLYAAHRQLGIGNLRWLLDWLRGPIAASVLASGACWLALHAASSGQELQLSPRWEVLGSLILGAIAFATVYVAGLARFHVLTQDDLVILHNGRRAVWRRMRMTLGAHGG